MSVDTRISLSRMASQFSHTELEKAMTPTLNGKDTAEVFVRRSIDGTYQAWVSLRLLVVGVQMAIFEEGEHE